MKNNATGKIYMYKIDALIKNYLYEKRGNTFLQSGIAADTMKINGAIRQFKQVSDLFAI